MILAFLLLQHVLASISIPPCSGVVLVPQVSLPLLGIYLLWPPLLLLLLLLLWKYARAYHDDFFVLFLCIM